MIYVKVKTERVYGHDNDGMPKIETIDQTLSEVVFSKFLKILPFQGYIKDKLKVIDAFHEGTNEPADKTPFAEELKKAIIPLVEESKVDEKSELEKENKALKERLAAIEAKLGISTGSDDNTGSDDADSKESTGDKSDEGDSKYVNVDEIDDIEVLRNMYAEKLGKQPHPNMGIAKLRLNLK